MVRIFLALFCTAGWHLDTFDVKNAFLQAPMPADQHIYIRLPKHSTLGPAGALRKLLKSLIIRYHPSPPPVERPTQEDSSPAGLYSRRPRPVPLLPCPRHHSRTAHSHAPTWMTSCPPVALSPVLTSWRKNFLLGRGFSDSPETNWPNSRALAV